MEGPALPPTWDNFWAAQTGTTRREVWTRLDTDALTRAYYIERGVATPRTVFDVAAKFNAGIDVTGQTITGQTLPGGVTLSGTPTTGQTPTVTGTGAATWQSPATAPSVTQVRTTVAIANTTVDTTILTGPTVAAAALDSTKTAFRLEADGNMDEIATSGTFTARVKINGVTIGSVNLSPSVTAAATGAAWSLTSRIYVDATGTGGAVSVHGTALVVNTVAGAKGAVTFQADAVAVNLTSGVTVTLTGVMATAGAGNILRCFRAILTQVA